MGDIFTNDSSTLRLTLQGKTDLAQFTLIILFVNGKIVESRKLSQRDFIEDFSTMLTNGENYVFFEVRALSPQGDELSHAFTSPMYVAVGKVKD